jgi:hypothetical protein
VRATLCAAATVVAGTAAHAEPAVRRAEPIVAIDDTRTHGPIPGEWAHAGATYRYILQGDDADITTLQLGLGPKKFTEQHARELLSWAKRVAFRVRASAVSLATDDRAFGPLTFALQRYIPIEPLAIAPLVHAHYGLEIAAATPWLSDRRTLPAEPIRTAMAVDTELASNGWSLRPLSAYVRIDALICRSIYFELGAGPEVFVPTIPATDTEYGVRYRAALGASFACTHRRASAWHDVAALLEYRGRVKLYADDAYPDAFGALAFEVQGRIPGLRMLLLGLSVSTDFQDFVTLGARLQLGAR